MARVRGDSDDWIAYAQSSLEAMASWLIENEDRLSGYPPGRTSVEYRMISGMARSTKARGGLVYWRMPKSVKKTHQVFVKLSDRLRYPVFIKYFMANEIAGAKLTLDEKYAFYGKKSQLSVSTMKRRVSQGEHIIAGFLANQ